MSIPTCSGLYIVQPTNVEPICSYRGDKRREGSGTPIKVGCIKFGKAKNLDRRRKNYEKTFGNNNIFFIPIVYSSLSHEIEKAVKIQVKASRIRSPKNRPLEWLTDISFQTLKQQIVDVAVKLDTTAVFPDDSTNLRLQSDP
jgi:hypothetical protein